MPSRVDYHPLWRSVIRPAVLLLDDFKCRLCSHESFENHVHHEPGSEMNCDFDKMHTLCVTCHSMVGHGRVKLRPRDIFELNINPNTLYRLQQRFKKKATL